MTDPRHNLLPLDGPEGTARTAAEIRIIGIIRSSRSIAGQLARTVADDDLRALHVSDHAGALGMAAFYSPEDRTIELDSGLINSQDDPTIASVLGHELRHAENRSMMSEANRTFARTVRENAKEGGDYTRALIDVLHATRRNEAEANIAGWNAFVEGIHSRTPGASLTRLAQYSTSRDVLEFGADGHVRFASGYSANENFTLDECDENVETMARRFYDLPGSKTRLGPLRDSDYTHYYAAAFIGHIGEVHVAYQPYRDEMRRRQGHNPRAAGPLGLDPLALPFEDLGIETGQLHRTGIDFGGTQHIPFLDIGTARTGFLTATDPKRLPPVPLPRPVLDMRERITAPSLDERTTARSTTRAPGRRDAQAIVTESAAVRARRTTTPRTVARTGTTTRTLRGHDR
ncbi:hypothetical protein F8O01_17665 [Pseudoclavibacter chungangensis]|uniref:Uncharacterized protein n=1 Tax=Pseudoclavibacter chungangensis TaxID=587635 RepID=A0A7J5BLZ8_9MICO|nr:hypothetical protein [Pseudoclavibacter chungangensis]KAB1651710.1 hypothetical protein F8O01_17665 [Pseudoclavibacter chungangensis]NYJ68120.1 hypothetical protein [Pseudoclavibacter chungangensis]